jgi:large subunit ribosomal protein L18
VSRKTLISKHERRTKRRRRIRGKVEGTQERPRLSIYRSNRGVFAQLIDDAEGRTVAAVTWVEPDLKGLKAMEQATRAGEMLAARAKEAGVEACVLDRGGFKYHGRVKALADGAREGGLRF